MMITSTRKEGELLDFQILHHSIDMAHVTLKQLPVRGAIKINFWKKLGIRYCSPIYVLCVSSH